jgi:hypothetical protein
VVFWLGHNRSNWFQNGFRVGGVGVINSKTATKRITNWGKTAGSGWFFVPANILMCFHSRRNTCRTSTNSGRRVSISNTTGLSENDQKWWTLRFLVWRTVNTPF